MAIQYIYGTDTVQQGFNKVNENFLNVPSGTTAEILQQAQTQAQEYTDSVISNKTLLINWDFTNPINQRGQSTYTNSTSTYTYTIDRWRLKYGTVNINTNCIEFINSQSAKTAVFGQVTAEYPGIEGKSIIFSAIINDELYTLSINSGWVFPSSGSTALGNSTVAENMRMYVYARNDKRLEVQFYISSTVSVNTSFAITKCKLEIGSISTLENSSPQNYGAELFKCQEYFFNIIRTSGTIHIGNGYANTTTTAYVDVTLPRVMRVAPTMSVSDPTLAYLYDTTVRSIQSIASDVKGAMTQTLKVTTDSAVLTVGNMVMLNSYTSGFNIEFDSELYD